MMSTKIKVSFSLDDQGQPIDCDAYRRVDANVLVEEACDVYSSFNHELMRSSVYVACKLVRGKAHCEWTSRASLITPT